MKKLSLGISDIEYTSKPKLREGNGVSRQDAAKEAQRIRSSLRVISVTEEELATYIGKGCTFCNPFKGKNGKDNCLPTDVIVVDIDKTDKDLEAVKMAVRGIIYYPTFSDGKDGTHSYRVIIRLDKMMETRLEYAYYANIIACMLEEKGIERDKSCNEMERLFFGTCYKVELHPSEYNYTKEELDHGPYAIASKELAEEKILKLSSSKKSAPKSKGNDVCARFLRDFNSNASYGVLVHLYANDFSIKYKDEVEFGEDELIKHVENYKEVRNNWTWDPVEKKRKLERYPIGSNRKDKLYIRLLKLKDININEGITFEGLLYAAVYEVYWYYDNSDNKLDKAWLFHTAKDIYEKETYTYGEDKNKLNMPAIREQGIAWQAVVGDQRRKQTQEHIREVFDSSLSIKENHQLFKEQGYTLSYDRYQRTVKEMDLDYKYKKRPSPAPPKEGRS